MDTGIFIALLNPSIALIIAATFVMLWAQQRTHLYLAILGASYAASAVGFLLQRFELPIGLYETKFISNLFFLSAGVGVASAIAMRYQTAIPVVALAVFALSGVGGVTWFMLVDPDLTWRIYTMNFAMGGICFLVAFEMRRIAVKRALDRLLMAAAVLSGLNFLGRTILTVQMSGGFENYDNLYTSPYWTSAMLSHAILSLIIALCLIMSAATDVYVSLRAEAHTDLLSGLLNRRGFEEKAQTLIREAQSRSTPLALVLADLDHFKSVNDAHGHAVGDTVIASFSLLLREACGGSVTIGRTGGEEFALLIPACTAPAARLLAEGLRTSLSIAGLSQVPERVGRVTASFGVSALSEGEDLETLLRRADKALYRAKKQGRNRVVVADASDETDEQPVAVSHERSA